MRYHECSCLPAHGAEHPNSLPSGACGEEREGTAQKAASVTQVCVSTRSSLGLVSSESRGGAETEKCVNEETKRCEDSVEDSCDMAVKRRRVGKTASKASAAQACSSNRTGRGKVLASKVFSGPGEAAAAANMCSDVEIGS